MNTSNTTPNTPTSSTARALMRASAAASLWTGSILPRLPTTTTSLRSPRSRASDVRSNTVSTAGGEDAEENVNGPTTTSRWRSFASKIIRVQHPDEVKESIVLGTERIVCFPQYALLRSDTGLQLSVLCAGYASRDRPLATASRSQRLFYNLAKRVAALPPAPQQPLNDDDIGQGPESLQNEADSVAESREAQDLMEMGSKDDLLAKLVEVGARSSDDEDGDGDLASQVADVANGVLAGIAPGSTIKKPHRDTISSPPLRQSTAPTSLSSTTVPTAEQMTRREGHNAWPKPFTWVPADLPHLHTNLNARLGPFFAPKAAVGRQVRIGVWARRRPATESGSMEKDVKLEDETLLEAKIVTIGVGGGFSELVEVDEQRLETFMREEGIQGERDWEKVGLRMVVELLRETLVGQSDPGEVTAHDSVDIDINCDREGIRVISDIDDTIKHTEVLSGARTIFRNVFVRDLDEIRVPGMVDWYTSLASHGALSFHYVSNSPVELFSSVVEPFLSGAGFPRGSVGLKQYGGTKSGMIANLWEDAGSRKREAVVRVLRTFEKAKFILIGDSGEQDMSLYVSLALEFPGRIRAIYIRDVTTPFLPLVRPTLTTSPRSSSYLPHAAVEPTVVKNAAPARHIPGAFDDGDLGDVGAAASPLRSKKELRRAQTDPIGLHLLHDPTTDPLSPNNPTSSTHLPHQQKLDDEHVTEERVALIEQFYARLVEAEKSLMRIKLKSGEARTVLRIFRHGGECQLETTAMTEEPK